MRPINRSFILYPALLLAMLLTACSQTAPVAPTAVDAVANEELAAEGAHLPTQPAAVQPSLTDDEQAQFASAAALLRQGDFAGATGAFQRLQQQLPAAPGVAYNLALSQWRAGDVDSAEQTLTTQPALQLHAPALNLAGVLARQQGRFAVAEQYFSAALKADSQYAPAHKNLAFLYELYLGQLLQARYHYQQYQALSEDPAVAGWLALLEQQLAQEQTDAR
ncbi:tetratricopeptide repeat protein [Rheinheimera fenheensis]|uniref:tetratricopeptide repeat protein n=1 Tax=Rheinheimera fenheensis TaxID=3152295 RepID=UPI0032611A97